MKRNAYLTAGFLVTAAAFGGVYASSAYAAAGSENDAMEFQKPKITLSQAVVAAEKHTAGNAVRAELEGIAGKPVYDVEVVNGKKVLDVRIDKDSGKVLAATLDKVDHDDAQDVDD